MEKKQALCILNPVAGRLESPQNIQAMLQRHIGKDYDISYRFTSARGDAIQAIWESAASAALLICCGGDGTLNEMITGMRLAGIKLPIFFVPCGTTNDLARTLGIPVHPPRCIETFPQTCPFPIDAGQFNQTRCFTYIAAFGAFTEISYATPQSAKNRWGYLAYLSQFFKGLLRARSHRVTLYADGQQYCGRYLFGSITNSLSIGRVLKLHGQGVSMDDGELELLLVTRPKNILALPYTALKLLLKKYNTKGILLKKCKSVSLQFDEEVPWTIDGEYGGKTNSVEIKVLPQFYEIHVGQ
ncbi:YegS/Rv2252/BmrU family lipid kinase [Christensenellaceae bacterium OttesenSCG-928-K19]|nr:YegS/Rv2252/BmrU family lipid kinase [Christensenellaceae bacterium OttesenSCG-928-K19]